MPFAHCVHCFLLSTNFVQMVISIIFSSEPSIWCVHGIEWLFCVCEWCRSTQGKFLHRVSPIASTVQTPSNTCVVEWWMDMMILGRPMCLHIYLKILDYFLCRCAQRYESLQQHLLHVISFECKINIFHLSIGWCWKRKNKLQVILRLHIVYLNFGWKKS